MEEKDILNGGTNELLQLKEELQGQIAVQEEIKNLQGEVGRLEKKLASEEKAVQSLINDAVNKARNEMAKGFDKDINHEQMNIKETKDKKAKEKAKGVKKRIESETESYVAENKALRKEIKDNFRERGIPRYCDSTWFYTLFMPKGIKDILILVLVVICVVFAIPMLLSNIIADKWWTKAIIYVITVLLEAAVYITIYLLTTDKDKYILEEMRENRTRVRENTAKVRQIKRGIKKDTDESMYNLGEFDSKIKEYEQAVTDITAKKNAALEEFDNNTKAQIIEDLTSKNQERIDNARNEAENSKSAMSDSEQKLKDITDKINETYGNVLGNDMLSISKVDKMIELIEEGQASNINEAINKIRANNA